MPFTIIGEAPGRVELQRNMPFVGPAGQLLNDMLALCGIDRDECYLTNTVCCVDLNRRPPTPTVEEILACHDRLWDEVCGVQSKIIICMGATASSQFFPGMTITAARGKLRSVDISGVQRTVISTYHPSAVLRGNKQYRDLILDDLTMARRYVG